MQSLPFQMICIYPELGQYYLARNVSEFHVGTMFHIHKESMALLKRGTRRYNISATLGIVDVLGAMGFSETKANLLGE